MTYCYYQGKPMVILVPLHAATGTAISYWVVTAPLVRDGSALRRLGRRKVEEARFSLITVHYGTVLGWMLCLCP